MIQRTKLPKQVPVPPEVKKEKKPKKPKKEKKLKPIKKRAVRCKDCRHFQSSPAKFLFDERDRKGVFRICEPFKDKRQTDSTICPFFEIADYIFCSHSEQWVHHIACWKRYDTAWNGGGARDNKCSRRCGLGKDLHPYIARLREVPEVENVYDELAEVFPIEEPEIVEEEIVEEEIVEEPITFKRTK